MPNYLVVTPTNGRVMFEIRHDEPPGAPWKWKEYEHDHPGAWCRRISDEEGGLSFVEIETEARAEHAQRQPKPAAPPAPEMPSGVVITLDALEDMLRWSLLCRHVIATNQDFDLTLGLNCVLVIPKKESKNG